MDRDADDDVEILGNDVAVDEDHLDAVRATTNNKINDATKKNYRNRLKTLMNFWQSHYPEYYAQGVRELTAEELANPDVFWWKNTRDLIYTGLNVKFVTAHMAVQKKKSDGKTSSFSSIRKINDAILFGAEQAGQRLPRNYFEEMDKFLISYKKETTVARKDGKLDEKECDPISWSLFKLILQWSLETEDVMVWVFSLLQWHCMARSINIGVLGFHNFRRLEDAIVCKYDSTKKDPTGEKVNDKHIYDNPFDGLLSVYCAIGVWCSLEQGRLSCSESIFLSTNTEDGSASSKYCTHLSNMLNSRKDTVECYMRSAHTGTHSFRKGSATLASSGTTCPPPVSSIAQRGEWSMGKILDVYWHFSAPGDTFLGRILTGLDPTQPEFATPPPHWTVTEPLENEVIIEGMQVMFGPILDNWRDNPKVNPTSFLVCCLASVVHHSNWLQEWSATSPGHPFSQIPLFSRPGLLGQLKELVTTKLGGDVNCVSGIPPHIECAQLMRKCVDLCEKSMETIKNMVEDVKKAVSDSIEDNAVANGQVSAAKLRKNLFEP